MRFIQGFLVALLGSVAANLVLLFILKPLVINPSLPLHALSVGPVTMLTVAGVIGATVVYALFRLFFARPNSPFIWISVVVLLLSFIPDYLVIGVTTGMFAGGTIATASALALMHIVAAIIIVWSLTKLWGPRAVAIVPNPAV